MNSPFAKHLVALHRVRCVARMLLCALGLAVFSLAPSASAQLAGEMPEEMQDVGIDEHLGDQVPLQLEFVDENGNVIRLADVFDGERPVLLSLNYSSCPLLCRYQLNGLVDGIRDMDWTTGEEFTILSVSIDPRERPSDAKKTEQKYLQDYGRPGVADGWYFLTGSDANIEQLADAVGYRYKFVPDTGEFSHAAALMVCTPDGKLSRYLYGVEFDPQTLRLSMVEASDGKIGSTMDQFILYCFMYDETKGRYGPVAFRIMQVGAGTTVFVLSLVLVPAWLRRKSSVQVAAEADETAPESNAVDTRESAVHS